MKTFLTPFFLPVVFVALVAALLSLSLITAPSKALGNEGVRKIVIFNSSVNATEEDQILKNHGVVKIKELKLVHGAAVVLSDAAAEKLLAKNPGVLRIDDDAIVEALKNNSSPLVVVQPAEVLPWGINKVDAELVWPTGNTGIGVKVGVVDTGIDTAHPDLASHIKGGVSTVNYTSSFNDDNGHGTHVAGIIGAIDNTIGVIGVAPGADLYAIKVLNRKGSGYISDIIEGLDWAINNGIQVVNMSLGTSYDIQSFHDAVKAVHNAGIVVVAAAGNSGGAVIYPAAYPEAIAVSATDSGNTIASWSSRGPQVDLAAPGVSIYSTYKGQTYATLSGTSMASPHVAGAAALVLDTSVGAFDANSNGKWDPNEVLAKLEARATDLGASGFDNLYGFGLLNANNAVAP